MLTSAVLWICLTPRGAPITLTIPAARLSVVLEAVGAQIGRRLAADPLIAREVLSVRVASAPEDAVLAHLADAVGGEWRRESGVSTLVVSAAASRADDLERQARRAKAIAKRIAEWPAGEDLAKPLTEEAVRQRAGEVRALAAKPPPPGKEPEALPQDKYADPGTTLLHSLVRRIPPATYTEIEPDVRIVFSESPTLLQISMPASTDDVVERYRHDERLVEQYLYPVIREGIVRSAADDDDADVDAILRKLKPLPESFKVDLAVQFDASGRKDVPEYDLNVVDPAGRIVAQVKEEPQDDSSDPEPEDAPPTSGASQISVGGPELEFLRFLRPPASGAPGRATLLARWRPRLLDPVRSDPLYSIGTQLVQLAESQGVDLVADLEDSTVFALDEGPEPRSFAAAALERTVASWARVTRSPGWIVVRPRNGAETRDSRLDRAAAKRLFERIVETDGMGVDDAAEYALSSQSTYLLGGWDYGYTRAIECEGGRNGAATSAGALDAAALRIFGTLSPEIKARLRNGRIRVGELSPEVQRLLERDFYWDNDSSDVELPPYEPTDALPNGLPQNGTLRLLDEPASLAVVPLSRVGSEERAMRAPIDASRLGWLLGGPRGAQIAGSYRRFRLARVHTFWLRADYAAGITRMWLFSELFYTPDPITTYDDLPKDFRDAVEAAKKMRQDNIRQGAEPTPKKPPPS